MPTCDNCDGPLNLDACGNRNNCCWAKAMAIKRFKKRMLYKYILEVIFDVVVSVLSVVADLISLLLYVMKGYWVLAAVTAVPVLLPTMVFTNVYLADETQGYCKLPKRQGVPRKISEAVDFENEDKNSTTTYPDNDNETTTTGIEGEGSEVQSSEGESKLEQFHSKLDFHCGGCHMLCYSCSGFWGGILRSICHKDRDIRESGAQMVRKSVKRLSKYLFGTFVLRFISLAWYAKALMFGIRAYKEPKKYMKIALPSTHWSYDLLVKLDFLQAALENAPQCVVQLYVLLTYPDENVMLAMITLFFSFLDFVRVSVSVQWDVHKGPVIAPSGCYGSVMWKLMNWSSWIFLYIGRSAALALVIATAENWSIVIPVIFLLSHFVLFMKLFSKAKYGVAAQKVFVSVFISIFFLPEFDSTELPTLTQLYYAVIHIENLFFIIPWNGLDFQYCFNNIRFHPPVSGFGGNFSSPLEDLNSSNSDTADDPTVDNCLIDPTTIVILVPTLTMIGIITRLAASKRMSEFKKTVKPKPSTMIMEERIANIYSKKWTSMSWKVLSRAFIRMLKKEVISKDECPSSKSDSKSDPNSEVYFVSPSLNKEFKASQKFIRDAFSFLSKAGEGHLSNSGRTKRSMSVDYAAGSPISNSGKGLSFRGKSLLSQRNKLSCIQDVDSEETDDFSYDKMGIRRSKSHDDVKTADANFYPSYGSDKELDMDLRIVKVDCPDGPYFLEMTWI